MARAKTAAALAESSGEAFTPEETKLMADNQAAENEPRESESDPAPAPEADKEPELALDAPEADAKPDIDPATGKQRKVDYGAFHAEREKRKAAEAKAQEKDRELATALGRFSVLEQLAKQQPQTQQQPQADMIPDINVDPVGHFKAKSEAFERQLADVNKWRETQEGERTAMNNVRQLTEFAVRNEQEFSKTTPDYQDAAAYVRERRNQELEFMGYKDAAVRQQIITQDALQIAAQAANAGVNPAEVVYNIAKARGFQVKSPAPAKVDAAKATDAVKIATVARGQQQASPLSEANGAAMPPTSPEAIVKMSDAEFEKWATDANWRKLMGG